MSLEDDIRTPPDAVWVRCPTRNWQGTCGPWTLERHRSDVAHAVRYVREDLAQSAELAALREEKAEMEAMAKEDGQLLGNDSEGEG